MVKSIVSPDGSNLAVIVVAAGKGTRFGSKTPKQFLMLKDKPVVVHALEAFALEFPKAHIILVLDPEEGDRYWQAATKYYSGQPPLIAYGGATRTESVNNALLLMEAQISHEVSVVMIHDGARPIVDRHMIRGLYAYVGSSAAIYAAVPCCQPTEAIAIYNDGEVRPIARSCFRTVQTPQTFDRDLLVDSYRQLRTSGQGGYDDDAAVFSAFSGHSIHSYPGDVNNIKITGPLDIRKAEIIIDTLNA